MFTSPALRHRPKLKRVVPPRKLPAPIRPRRKAPAALNIRDLEKAIAEGEQLLAKYPDNDFSPAVMFQLVELRQALRPCLSKENGGIRFATEAFRCRRNKIRTGLAPRQHRDAVELGYKILEKYATASFNDKVVYRIAVPSRREQSERSREYFQSSLPNIRRAITFSKAIFAWANIISTSANTPRRLLIIPSCSTIGRIHFSTWLCTSLLGRITTKMISPKRSARSFI
jgi:hypothetical protein